jgi:uncharacterized caspase-like protein
VIGPVSLPALALFAARIAIVASSNQASGQATLRYADRDAERMAAVLGELGSFAPADVWSMPRATAPALRDALERAERAAEREPGSEIFFYSSGHADGGGLLLGDDRLGYDELRARLARSRAQVRVAVLDACNSGAATQPKGGRPGAGAPFAPPAPVQVNGAVILAASGTEEVAQESGELEGSVFTHHLVSALRGAGDRDGDGVVTLAEAYAHVYARTLASTVPSLWGAQHPSFDTRLQGTGDLVLTTLRRGRQGLVFAPEAQQEIVGTYSVLDAKRDVVGEVRPDARRAVRLALPAGRYRVAHHARGALSIADVTLVEGADLAVDRAALRPAAPELALAKGGEPPPAHGLFVDYALVGRGLATAGISSELGVSYRRRFSRWSLAPRLSYGETQPDAVGAAYHLRRVAASAFALDHLVSGAVDVELGGGVSFTYLEQLDVKPPASGLVPGVAAQLVLEVPLARWVALRLTWDAGFEVVPLDGEHVFRAETRAAVGLGVMR